MGPFAHNELKSNARKNRYARNFKAHFAIKRVLVLHLLSWQIIIFLGFSVLPVAGEVVPFFSLSFTMSSFFNFVNIKRSWAFNRKADVNENRKSL
jgi:hypothetical protein